MKFFAATLALLATVDATDKKALLRKAVRLAKEGRTLEQAEFQITGDYSVQFDHCMSLTVDNDEMKEADEYGNSLMTYIQQGTMVAQKSFVTFNICQTEMCGYEANNDQYIIEAGQYVAITSTVDIKNHERYCEGCREAQDYCLYGNQQYGEQGQNQGGQRKLQNWQQDMEIVECDVCKELKCFEEDNQYAQYSIQEQDIDEWIQQTAECVETGWMWQNMPLYAGFMCNDVGTGVELALFMDQDCSIYNSMVSFSDMASQGQQYGNQQNGGQQGNFGLMQMAVAAKDFVQGAFTKDLDCAEIEYISPEQAYEQAQNQQNQQNDGQAWYKQAGETCQNLMEGLPLATCGYGYGEYREYREQNQDEYNAYAWYQPQLEAEDADDLQGVCSIIQKFNGEYSDLHTYNKKESGSFYTYKKEGSGRKAGKVFGWILLVACVAGAAFFAATKLRIKKDSRKEPLVAGQGALA